MIFEAIENKDVKALKKALADGAKIQTPNEDGMQALHVAALEGHDEMVGVLLAAKAKVDAQDREKATPLMYAAVRSHTKVADRLLQARGQPQGEGQA